jgi:hypothetical protein
LETSASLLPVPAVGGGASTGKTIRWGGWCNNKELQKLLELPGQTNHCPLNTLTQKSKARESAKWVMDEKQANPGQDVEER